MPGDDEGRPPPSEPAHIEALLPTEPPTSRHSTTDGRQVAVTADAYDWLQAERLAPELIDAALELAAAWEVFPCRPSGPQAKSPLTLHGHHDATMDPDVIKAWWLRWRDAMISAAVPDSLLVVDIDPRNGGDLEKLVALVGDLPPTLTVWSGRNDGGRHLYYQRPTGTLTSTRLPEGIDLKANGYCILPAEYSSRNWAAVPLGGTCPGYLAVSAAGIATPSAATGPDLPKRHYGIISRANPYSRRRTSSATEQSVVLGFVQSRRERSD